MGDGAALTYVAITPARDEETNLRRVAEALIAQSVRPLKWIIVENGSTDGTLELARGLAEAHSWIELTTIEPSPGYKRTMAEVAFQAGVDALAGTGDLVAKIDADVSFDADYFKGVLAAFESDPTLGIASGACRELHGGTWEELTLLGDHCWGPSRTYRRPCLEAVLPLEGALFTLIDETKARLAGFATRTLVDLHFYHHRPEATNDVSLWGHWRRQGVGSYVLGYRPTYLLVRCGYRARRQPTAVALIVGYLSAFWHRTPQYHDRRVIHAIREQQRARQFLATVRSARSASR
ncbi:MAG TPA: glycosyltransferase family 2 protein [Solirubrobacteraceae bacterium]|nr:glycosyltransferase family 2 protein [Solirubrobacteraceae bacterium]